MQDTMPPFDVLLKAAVTGGFYANLLHSSPPPNIPVNDFDQAFFILDNSVIEVAKQSSVV